MLVLFNSNSWLCSTASAAMTHCSANKLQASRPKFFPPSQASATLYCRCLHTCVETVKSLKKWKANKKDDFFGCCEVQNRFVLRRFIVVEFMGMRFREFFEVPNFSYVSKLLLERLERKLFGESLKINPDAVEVIEVIFSLLWKSVRFHGLPLDEMNFF